jgi:3'(2'), 5'-bisphosphate nucleotidase
VSSSKGGFAREREVALAAVREAARLSRRVQERSLAGGSLAKKDRSPVTIADFGVQALVSHALLRAFPEDELMGEEEGSAFESAEGSALLDRVVAEVAEHSPGAHREDVVAWIDRARGAGGSGRFWALDPVDGTKGFLRGEQYAIALSLLEGGEVKVAALGCPNLAVGSGRGVVLLAVRGRGAESLPLEGRGAPSPARASPTVDPRAARLLESVEAAHGDLDRHEQIRRRLGVTAPAVRLDSQAKYALLARGEADVYLRLPTSEVYRESLWDQAAGSLVIEEAGGRVTDVHGRALDFTTGRKLERNQGIVATNGPLHDAFLAAVAAVRSGRS